VSREQITKEINMANTAKLKKMNKVQRTEPIPQDVHVVVHKAWDLLDALQARDFAHGLEETQRARWDVTEAQENLKKALTDLAETGFLEIDVKAWWAKK
jgi:hypothetical protein